MEMQARKKGDIEAALGDGTAQQTHDEVYDMLCEEGDPDRETLGRNELGDISEDDSYRVDESDSEDRGTDSEGQSETETESYAESDGSDGDYDDSDSDPDNDSDSDSSGTVGSLNTSDSAPGSSRRMKNEESEDESLDSE